MYTACSSIQGCALAVPGAPSNSPLPLCDNDILLTHKSYVLGTCGVFGLGKVRFFLGGEGWGILVFFSQKSVGPPLPFNKKTPDPPPLGD